jgi:hypothetical protein
MLTTNPQPGKGNAYMCNVIFSAIQFWMDRRSGKGEMWEHDRTTVGLGESIKSAWLYTCFTYVYMKATMWSNHFSGIQYPMDVYEYTNMGVLRSVMNSYHNGLPCG